MKKWTKTILTAISVSVLVLSLAACNGGDDFPEFEPIPVPPEYTETATLIADFSAGSELLNQKEYFQGYNGSLDIAMLSDYLSDLTGLDFFADGKVEGGKAFISWRDESTLVAGLDDREQSEEFFFYDAISLNWFMMDSLAATVKKNFPEVTEVYYSGENGESVVFPNPEDMASQGLPVLPIDLPYEGSTFFVSHADGRGDMSDDSADGDIPYWDGLDFGPNLSYAEEYEIQGDPGEYMNAAEAAKLTFEAAKLGGHIPGYNGSVAYTMTLTDLADVNGEECYVYRCGGGAFGAGFAYAYQSGGIYMQGYGGQWVPLDAGSTDPADVNWWGEYNSVNYVLGITNYNGTSFHFTIDDVDSDVSGVAALDPDNPYSAHYGEMVFSFDGIDTINITGGDYAETYFRSQY